MERTKRYVVTCWAQRLLIGSRVLRQFANILELLVEIVRGALVYIAFALGTFRSIRAPTVRPPFLEQKPPIHENRLESGAGIRRLASLNWVGGCRTHVTFVDRRLLRNHVRNPMPAALAGGVRQLFAIAHFDMVSYSQLIWRDDVGTIERLRVVRSELIDPCFERFGGFLVHTGGDSLLVVFVSATEAVRCAVEVQRGISACDRGSTCEHRMRFRIGIDVGETIADAGNLHGDGVNTAVRLQAICPPGGICISRTVFEFVKNRVDMQFEPLGVFDLKNITRPTEAFVLRQEGGGGGKVHQSVSVAPPQFHDEISRPSGS